MLAVVDLREHRITGQYDHIIGVATPGFLSLAPEDQIAIVQAFETAPKGDHFYSISLGEIKVFVCENGERGYTAMLPGEY